MAVRLPVEVVAYIMRYLSVSDRKEAALVNRLFYEASLDPILLRDTTVTFIASLHATDLPPGLAKRASHLILENLDFNSDRNSILETCANAADNLISLSLKGSNITEKMLINILSHCYNMEKLDISCCNSMFMTGTLLSNNNDVEMLKKVLVNVKEVNMSNIRYLSDITFNRVMSVCPNTQRLSLTGNQVIFHSDAYYNKKRGYDDESGAVITFANLLKYVTKQKYKLTALDLSRTAITDDGLDMITGIEGLKLEELKLVSCSDITGKSIVSLCVNQPTIQVLDLTQCLEVGDSAINAISSRLTELRKLKVSHCRMISDLSITKLNKIQKLEQLDISSCYTLSSMGLAIGICKDTMKNMTHLNMNCCSSVMDSFMTEAALILTALVYLDLGSCSITNKSVLYISKYLKRLRYLRLAWCKEIDDNGLLGIRGPAGSHNHEEGEGLCKCTRKKQFVNIFNLPVKHGHHTPKCNAEIITRELAVESSADTSDEEFLPLSNLTMLKTLDLAACHKISDDAITEIMCFKDLQVLNLGLIPRLTDETPMAVARAIPSLEGFYITQCNKITDKGILEVIDSCPRLSHLDISSLDKISNRVLEELYCKSKRLQFLDVSMCSNVTPEAVEMLENNLTHLKTVQKRLVGGRIGFM